MKKSLEIIFLIAILFSSTLYSQPAPNPQDVIINPFWEFYTANYLSTVSAGRGFTGVASINDISGSSLNPASVYIDKKYQVNVQYTYKTDQPWLPGLSSSLNLKHLPPSLSAAFGYRINKTFQTGFIYSNPQSMNFDLGVIIRTDEFGNEIGRYDGYEKYSTNSFSIPFVYTGKRISLGLNLNYTMFTSKSNIQSGISVSNSDLTASTNRFNIDAGFLFKLSNNFSIGGKVTPGYLSKVKYTFSDGTVTENSNARFPWKASAGLEYTNPDKRLRLDLDYSFEGTSSVSELKNRNDFHFGGEYDINKIWTARAGFFTLMDYRNSSVNFLDPVGKYDQLFFSLGSTVKFNSLKISLAILDSHISPGMIKNTYLNAGATYNF